MEIEHLREAITPGNTGLIAAYAIASVSLASRVWPALAPYLAFVPANVYSAHHYLWTIVTYALCEPSLIVAIVQGGVIIRMSRTAAMSPTASGAEVALAALCAVAGTAAVLFLYSFLTFALTTDEEKLFASMTGSGGVVLTFTLWAAKHGPNTSVEGTGITCQSAPFLVLLALALLSATGLTSSLLQDLVTGAIAWAWLRFYSQFDSDAPAESFSITSLAPPPLRPVVSAVATPVRALTAALGCCRPRWADPVSTPSRGTAALSDAWQPSPSGSGSTSTGNSVATATTQAALAAAAERRRQKALALLDEKLAEMAMAGDDVPADVEASGAVQPGGSARSEGGAGAGGAGAASPAAGDDSRV